MRYGLFIGGEAMYSDDLRQLRFDLEERLERLEREMETLNKNILLNQMILSSMYIQAGNSPEKIKAMRKQIDEAIGE